MPKVWSKPELLVANGAVQNIHASHNWRLSVTQWLANSVCPMCFADSLDFLTRRKKAKPWPACIDVKMAEWCRQWIWDTRGSMGLGSCHGTGIYSTLHELCNIKPGDMGGILTETRNTVIFIGSLIKEWIRVENKDDTSKELLKVVYQILEVYFFILSPFSHD